MDRGGGGAQRASAGTATSAAIDESISAAAALHMDGGATSGSGSRGHGTTSHTTSNSHSSPCANKRQIIVQNEMMESPASNSVNSTSSSGGQGQGINGSAGHETIASPHTNSVADSDHSIDSARWRKTSASHSQAWDASVSSHLNLHFVMGYYM